MEGLRVRAAAEGPPAKRFGDGVKEDGGAPVEGAADDIVTSNGGVGKSGGSGAKQHVRTSGY